MKYRQKREANPNLIDGNNRTSAVLVALIIPQEIWNNGYDRYLDHIYLILEQRSQHLRNPGDMAFPGGSRDPEDDSLVDTALREANEEIGMEKTDFVPIDLMDEFVSSSQMIVHPVIGWKIINHPVDQFQDYLQSRYYARTSETDEVCVVPLIHLLDPNQYISTDIRFQADIPRTVFIRFFNIDPFLSGKHIWGLTASILRRLIDIVFPSHLLPDETIPS